eukprot:1246344-Amphidinium_carterae.1
MVPGGGCRNPSNEVNLITPIALAFCVTFLRAGVAELKDANNLIAGSMTAVEFTALKTAISGQQEQRNLESYKPPQLSKPPKPPQRIKMGQKLLKIGSQWVFGTFYLFLPYS